MGVDVEAVIEWNSSDYSLNFVKDSMNAGSSFFGSSFKSGWEYDFPIERICEELCLELLNEQVLGSLQVGVSLLTINYPIRWGRFCRNIEGEFDRYYDYYIAVASQLGASEIIFLPDSSFPESKALDLVETKSSLENFKFYLNELGSKRKAPDKVIFNDKTGWNSNGYICEKIT